MEEEANDPEVDSDEQLADNQEETQSDVDEETDSKQEDEKQTEEPQSGENKSPDPQDKPDDSEDKKPIASEETQTNDGENDKDSDEEESQVIIVTTLEAGQSIQLLGETAVYGTAYDAEHGLNQLGSYPAGNYTIFSVSGDMINVTRNPGNPGGWINPKNISLNTTGKTTQSQTSEEQTNLPSGEKYSWSWAYPGNAATALAQNNGIYRISNTNQIYLTFDNGYEHNNLTADILDTLKTQNVKATFFITSGYMKQSPALVKRMVNEGHNVGNHTRNHLNPNAISASDVRADIKGWEEDFKALTGFLPSVKLYRPPEGKFNQVSLNVAKSMGYKTVLWAYAYGDWDTNNQPNEASSLKKLVDSNRDGNVVLLHAISQTNANILADYIQQTRTQGYSFGHLR